MSKENKPKEKSQGTCYYKKVCAYVTDDCTKIKEETCDVIN